MQCGVIFHCCNIRFDLPQVLYTMEEDHDWPKAELDGKEGKIPVCFIDIDIRP